MSPKENQTPGTDLTKAASGRVREMAVDIMGRLGQRSPEDAAVEIMGRLLEAETAEDVLAPRGTVETPVGIPHTIKDVRWHPSRIVGGPTFFATIDAVGPNGAFVYSTSSLNIIAALYRLEQLGALADRVVVIRETAEPTERGYHPQWLELAEPPPAESRS